MSNYSNLQKGKSLFRWLAILLFSSLLLITLLQAKKVDGSQANPRLGFFINSGQTLGENAGNAVAVGDLDGDEDLDGVLDGQVWLNDGTGNFTQKSQDQDLEDTQKSEIALADVDGDEDLDLIIARPGTNEIWFNDGSAAFSNTFQSLGIDSWALAVGDVNGDEHLDLILTSESGHNLYLNDGSGEFDFSEQDFGGNGFRAAALEDVDGDQDLDAFFADCSTYLNDGNGDFTFKEDSICGAAFDPVTLDMGDVDDDNDIDAVIGNATKNANLVMINDGDGNFGNFGGVLGASSTEEVVLSDVDLDGDLDLYSANTSEAGSDPADKIWFNDGQGVFTDSGQALGETNSHGAALGDVDGDGDPDALVGSAESANQLYTNGVYFYYYPFFPIAGEE